MFLKPKNSGRQNGIDHIRRSLSLRISKYGHAQPETHALAPVCFQKYLVRDFVSLGPVVSPSVSDCLLRSHFGYDQPP